jgi:hypothetical protein
MTQPGRKDHIIPVVLDDNGMEATMGISKALGRIDLRDVWTEIQKGGSLTTDIVNALRNRCVLPLLERIDAASDTI